MENTLICFENGRREDFQTAKKDLLVEPVADKEKVGGEELLPPPFRT